MLSLVELAMSRLSCVVTTSCWKQEGMISSFDPISTLAACFLPRKAIRIACGMMRFVHSDGIVEGTSRSHGVNR